MVEEGLRGTRDCRGPIVPIALVVVVGLQLACAVHVVRSGRPLYWLFLILAFPAVGCLIYVAVAVLPDLVGSPAAQQAAQATRRAIDPERDFRRLAERLEVTDTVENRQALAEECLRLGRAGEAIELYRAALTGMHAEDPWLRLGLAKAKFAAGDFAGCVQVLDDVRRLNPKFESSEGHLLYARTLEELGRFDDALVEYDALVQYFGGEEAKVRYAFLLRRRGLDAKARQILQGVVRAVERGPKHYRRAQRNWYEAAKKALAD